MEPDRPTSNAAGPSDVTVDGLEARRAQRVDGVRRYLEREVVIIMREAGEEVDSVPRAFAEVGWDSLNVVEIQYRLLRTFGREVPADVFEVDDFERIAEAIVDAMDDGSPWPEVLTA